MTPSPVSVPKSAPFPVATEGGPWRVGTLAYTTGGLAVLFCWLLWGDFAWSMRERSVTWVMQLLLKKFEASDFVASLLLGTLPSAIAMIVSPVVSYRSDRHRGPWGRRIPFLVLPTPFIVLSMLGLAYSSELGAALHSVMGSRSPGLNPSILIVLAVFWTTFEVSVIVAGAVFGGLINDVVPQRFLGRFYGLFRALSLIAGIIFNYWLLAKAERHYTWVFFGIAVLYGFGFTLMCVKVKEGEYPPPPPPQARGNVRLYFKECFGNAHYVWIFAAMTCSGIAFAPIFMFSVFFAHSVGMSMADYGKAIALMYMVSLGLSYPLGVLTDRFHPLRTGIAALILHAAVVLWGGLYARDAATFGLALVSEGVLAGVWWTCTASLGQRLYPRARFAELASAQGILGGLASMFLAPGIGLFLDHTGHVYRYTFLISFGLTLLTLATLLVVHARFMALGGTKGYVPPAC